MKTIFDMGKNKERCVQEIKPLDPPGQSVMVETLRDFQEMYAKETGLPAGLFMASRYPSYSEAQKVLNSIMGMMVDNIMLCCNPMVELKYAPRS